VPEPNRRARRPRAEVEQSEVFRQLQGQATEEFLRGNYEEAEKLTAAAIRENPEMFAVDILRSEIHIKMGRTRDDVDILAHSVPFTRDVDTILTIADRFKVTVTDVESPEWETLLAVSVESSILTGTISRLVNGGLTCTNRGSHGTATPGNASTY
jgi:hypothetical protein